VYGSKPLTLLSIITATPTTTITTTNIKLKHKRNRNHTLVADRACDTATKEIVAVKQIKMRQEAEGEYSSQGHGTRRVVAWRWQPVGLACLTPPPVYILEGHST